MYAQVIQKNTGSKPPTASCNNSKEQFKTSPDLINLYGCNIEALDAHQATSQALDNPYVRTKMVDLLIDKFGLWEELRERAAS